MKPDIKKLVQQFDERNTKNLEAGKELSAATRDIDDVRGEFGVPFPKSRSNPSPTPTVPAEAPRPPLKRSTDSS